MVDYANKIKLDGKLAYVCGGLGLIGKQIAIALAQLGSKVIILDIDEKKGMEFKKYCEEQDLNIDFYVFDSTAFDKYEMSADNLRARFGTPDIFVNTAYPRTSDWGNKLEDVSTSSWQKNVDMHMNSYCILTKTFAELMKNDNIQGTIVNVASIYGVVGPDFEIYAGTEMTCPAAYSAIKGGIINFSRYAASYYGPSGIRVNALCPGGVLDEQDERFIANYKTRTPLKRLCMPEDIASAVAFLSSEAASYITGTTFMVDGGWTSI